METLPEEHIVALGEAGFFVIDGFVGDETARRVRDTLDELALRPAGMGRGALFDESDRGDLIAWLDDLEDDAALQPLRRGFAELMEVLNREAWLGLRRFEVQLARYPGGGARYVRHRDAFAGQLASRRVTAIVYLNPTWTPADGGLLRLHLASGTRDVEPLLDRLVVFLSERIEHEVLPVQAPRVAATAWYY